MTCRIDVNFIHADERKGKKEKKAAACAWFYLMRVRVTDYKYN